MEFCFFLKSYIASRNILRNKMKSYPGTVFNTYIVFLLTSVDIAEIKKIVENICTYINAFFRRKYEVYTKFCNNIH